MKIGNIGNFVFEVSAEKVLTWQAAERSLGARFARHNVFGRKPLMEYTGPEAESMALSVHLNSSVGTDPEIELKKLEAIINSGKAQALVIGGRPLGSYVIESMQETFKRTDRQGKVIVADISLNLVEYTAPKSAVSAGVKAVSGVAVVSAEKGELLRKAEALREKIYQSELCANLRQAQAACESLTSAALDVTNGVAEAVKESVSEVTGLIRETAATMIEIRDDAISAARETAMIVDDVAKEMAATAIAASNIIMQPANVALAAMQSVLDEVESIAPLGLDGASRQLAALREKTDLTEDVQKLMRKGPDAVSARLEAAVSAASRSNLNAVVQRLGAK